ATPTAIPDSFTRSPTVDPASTCVRRLTTKMLIAPRDAGTCTTAKTSASLALPAIRRRSVCASVLVGRTSSGGKGVLLRESSGFVEPGSESLRLFQGVEQ